MDNHIRDQHLTDEMVTNERIKARTVRLIQEGGTAEIIPYNDAMARANREGLDLLLVAAGDPPVCRIIDADRFRFEKKRMARDQARRQREMMIETKEIQLRPVTDDNDLLVKVRRAKSFLQTGDKVKVVVKFRGRERSHRDWGRRVIERFLSEIGDHKIDKPMSDGDSDLSVTLGSLISKSELLKQKQESSSS